jgi:catechol 2,3-dioxygenase-like lactoylglutathione lyase family enzyme
MSTSDLKPQPMIAVADIEASSAWYQRVLGLASGHGGLEYEQLMSGREIVLQLHHWDAHEHPHLGNPASTPYGNGVALWFHAEAIDAAYARAVSAGAAVLEELKVNLLAGIRRSAATFPMAHAHTSKRGTSSNTSCAAFRNIRSSACGPPSTSPVASS